MGEVSSFFQTTEMKKGFLARRWFCKKRDNWTELAFCIFGNSCLCVSHFLDTLRNYDFMFCVLVCVCRSLGCCCACAFANFLRSFYNVIPSAFVGLRIQESFQGLSSRIAQFLHQWHLGAMAVTMAIVSWPCWWVASCSPLPPWFYVAGRWGNLQRHPKSSAAWPASPASCWWLGPGWPLACCRRRRIARRYRSMNPDSCEWSEPPPAAFEHDLCCVDWPPQ